MSEENKDENNPIADVEEHTPKYVVEEDDEAICWYTNYKGNLVLHRVGGPAYEGKDGSKEYYLLGVVHRTNGPAKIMADGTKKYYNKGKLHRENGPAIEYPDGGKEFWMNGEQLTVWTKDKKIIRSKNRAMNALVNPVNALIKKVGEYI